MKKGEKNLRALIDKYQANCDRIRDIADTIEKENRERNDTEEQEYRALSRENEILRMKAAALAGPAIKVAGSSETVERQILREVNAGAKQIRLTLTRAGEDAESTDGGTEFMKTTAVEGTGIIAIDQQEMLKPLRAGLIYDLVGIKVMTGLPGNTIRWPRHGKAVAQWANEAERAEDSKVDFTKLETAPRRLTCAVPVTRELLESSVGVVESAVREEIPQAIVERVNEAMFSTTGKYQAKDGSEKDLPVKGPFVGTKNVENFAGAVPTRKELLKIKAKIAATGISLVGSAWVMTEAMKAELEDTKVDAGSGRFLCENNMILGYPVFCTEFIGEGNIGFGNWFYQASGFFGRMDVTADPFTLLRNNSVDFVTNAHFGTATLYDEAFVLGKCKTA